MRRIRSDLGAPCTWRCLQSQKLLYFVERKTELLRLFDKLHPATTLGGIQAVIRNSPRRPRNQPASLIVTQSLDMNLCLLREFADGKRIHFFSFETNLHPVPGYGVKPYVFKVCCGLDNQSNSLPICLARAALQTFTANSCQRGANFPQVGFDNDVRHAKR